MVMLVYSPQQNGNNCWKMCKSFWNCLTKTFLVALFGLKATGIISIANIALGVSNKPQFNMKQSDFVCIKLTNNFS